MYVAYNLNIVFHVRYTSHYPYAVLMTKPLSYKMCIASRKGYAVHVTDFM